MRPLAIGPQDGPVQVHIGLVLVHGQAKPGYGMTGCDTKGSKLDVSLLASRASS